MRLNRLDLTRYGKFTDRSIDFGAPLPASASAAPSRSPPPSPR